jgi:hypothetical protein
MMPKYENGQTDTHDDHTGRPSTSRMDVKAAGTDSGKPKQHLAYRQYHSNEKVEMAIREWLQKQEPNFYCDGIFKLVPR